MSKIKLFCFPYAGGSSSIYKKWDQYSGREIEFIPVELAGRGRRINEMLYKDVPEAIRDVFRVLKNEIQETSYAFFGHSMGAMIAYELAQKIRDSGLPQPAHIFFSGRGAPHVQRTDDKKYHLMNDRDFKEEVINLGATPPDLFEDPELAGLFIPLLRSDFKLAEAEFYDREIKPLDCSITVFCGRSDDLSAEECDGWKEHTLRECRIHYFDGGHFFLHEETKQIISIINSTLNGSAGHSLVAPENEYSANKNAECKFYKNLTK